MTVKLYAFTCGTVTGEFAHLMEGGEGDITVPIPVFLIEHPKGRALFDTGLHPDCQFDPAGRLGSRHAGLFRIGFQPGEEVSARLEAIGAPACARRWADTPLSRRRTRRARHRRAAVYGRGRNPAG